MFTVEVRHHTKAYRNGDLEDKLELIQVENFKTRSSAKAYIERELRGKDNVEKSYHRGDEPSNCWFFTGVRWQHENTGEEMREYYQYTLKKTKAK